MLKVPKPKLLYSLPRSIPLTDYFFNCIKSDKFATLPPVSHKSIPKVHHLIPSNPGNSDIPACSYWRAPGHLESLLVILEEIFLSLEEDRLGLEGSLGLLLLSCHDRARVCVRGWSVDRDLDFGPFVMNPFLFFSHGFSSVSA